MTGFRTQNRSLTRCASWTGLVLAVGVLVGCGSKSSSTVSDAPEPPAQGTPGKSKSKASLTASPNPVPAGGEKFGKTTISWDTGDGSLGEVYVSTNAGEEKRFSGAKAKGSQAAEWIGKGEYEFRLYDKDHKTLLSTVKVRRSKE